MLDEYLEFAKELAKKAGRIMEHYFELEEKGIKIKDDQTPVTLADTEINSMVINEVKSKFPTHGVLGEEESFNLEAEDLWVVDPVDGTSDFTNKIPHFAFSIALVQRGEARVAVVYNPPSGRMLCACAGGGAYENGKKIQLTDDFPASLNIDAWLVDGVANSAWAQAEHAVEAYKLIDSGKTAHRDWPIAYALALVAGGDLDATLSTIKTPWDVAAGCLIAKEAGAKVTDLYGQPVDRWDKEVRGVMVAKPQVHDYFLKLLAPVLKDEK